MHSEGTGGRQAKVSDGKGEMAISERTTLRRKRPAGVQPCGIPIIIVQYPRRNEHENAFSSPFWSSRSSLLSRSLHVPGRLNAQAQTTRSLADREPALTDHLFSLPRMAIRHTRSLAESSRSAAAMRLLAGPSRTVHMPRAFGHGRWRYQGRRKAQSFVWRAGGIRRRDPCRRVWSIYGREGRSKFKGRGRVSFFNSAFFILFLYFFSQGPRSTLLTLATSAFSRSLPLRSRFRRHEGYRRPYI